MSIETVFVLTLDFFLFYFVGERDGDFLSGDLPAVPGGDL
jgi:hypothetical protein